MRRRPASLALALLCTACPSSSTDEVPPKPAEKRKPAPAARGESSSLLEVSFDDDQAGTIPATFEVGETNGVGTPATWAVRTHADAPSPPSVFGVASSRNSGQNYNVALLRDRSLADVDVRVMVKAEAGKRDQGGGVVFRALGFEDYYVARWNPLENNARFYVVAGSERSALAKVDLDLNADAWHELRVVAEGDRFELLLDDASVLTVRDQTLTKPGRVGLWTKTDAVTWFDDVSLVDLGH